MRLNLWWSFPCSRNHNKVKHHHCVKEHLFELLLIKVGVTVLLSVSTSVFLLTDTGPHSVSSQSMCRLIIFQHGGLCRYLFTTTQDRKPLLGGSTVAEWRKGNWCYSRCSSYCWLERSFKFNIYFNLVFLHFSGSRTTFYQLLKRLLHERTWNERKVSGKKQKSHGHHRMQDQRRMCCGLLCPCEVKTEGQLHCSLTPPLHKPGFSC